MATQQAGLFTQGPSVEDLLQKRNTRAANLQQQLMAQAAQGSRTPAKARAFSLLGSSLGRALSGAVGGGQDQQLAEIRAKEAQRQDFVGRYSKALTGTPQEQLAEGQAMINAGYHEYGGKLVIQAREGLKDAKATEVMLQQEREAQLQLSLEREANLELADSIREKHGVLASQVEAGRPEAITLAYKLLAPENEAKVAKQGNYRLADGSLVAGFVQGSARYVYGADGTPKPMPTDAIWVGEDKGLSTAEKKLAAFAEGNQSITELMATPPEKGGITQQAGAVMLDNLKSALGMTTDPNITETAKQDSKNISSYLTDANKDSLSSGKRLASYQQSIAMLDAGLYTGTGAGALQTVRKLLIATGLAPKDVEVTAANVEMFRANIMDAVLARVAETKGSISQQEMKDFAKASIGLDKTVAGNKLLLETAMAAEQWVRDRGAFINKKYAALRKGGKTPKRFEMREFVKEWEDSNMLILPTAEQMAEAKGEGVVSLSGGVLTGKETPQELFALADALDD